MNPGRHCGLGLAHRGVGKCIGQDPHDSARRSHHDGGQHHGDFQPDAELPVDPAARSGLPAIQVHVTIGLEGRDLLRSDLAKGASGQSRHKCPLIQPREHANVCHTSPPVKRTTKTSPPN